MARIGFLTLYATGHLNPCIALARALQKRGHEPVFFNLLDTAFVIENAGMRFIPFGLEAYPVGALKSALQKTAELTGPAAFALYVERMILLFRCSFQELPSLLREQRMDLLVVDQVLFSGSTIAEYLGIPFISLANALLVNREDLIPPPVLLWPYEDSEAAKERNRKGWAGVDQAYSPLLTSVNEQRAAWNLPLYDNLIEDSFSPLAQICQQPAYFDFPRHAAPATLHMVGHLQDELLSHDVPFDWEWLDGRPLIYASCGTLQNRLESIFRVIIEACAPLDAQTVIALGQDALSASIFGDVPSNIKLVPYAPQRRIIERAALCLTHAGLNTTLDCLDAGVPMIAFPIASEQPGIAVRIAHLGVGVVIPLVELAPEVLRLNIAKVLGDPSYKTAAVACKNKSAELHPSADAVQIMEQILSRFIS